MAWKSRLLQRVNLEVVAEVLRVVSADVEKQSVGACAWMGSDLYPSCQQVVENVMKRSRFQEYAVSRDGGEYLKRHEANRLHSGEEFAGSHARRKDKSRVSLDRGEARTQLSKAMQLYLYMKKVEMGE